MSPTSALFATLCISGTLHGTPTKLCREFQLRTFTTERECNAEKEPSLHEHLKLLSRFNIIPSRVDKVHCGKAEPSSDPDDL